MGQGRREGSPKGCPGSADLYLAAAEYTTAGDLCRCVKELLDHLPHLVDLVFDVLLRVLGEGHVAISAEEDNP